MIDPSWEEFKEKTKKQILRKIECIFTERGKVEKKKIRIIRVLNNRDKPIPTPKENEEKENKNRRRFSSFAEKKLKNMKEGSILERMKIVGKMWREKNR